MTPRRSSILHHTPFGLGPLHDVFMLFDPSRVRVKVDVFMLFDPIRVRVKVDVFMLFDPSRVRVKVGLHACSSILYSTAN